MDTPNSEIDMDDYQEDPLLPDEPQEEEIRQPEETTPPIREQPGFNAWTAIQSFIAAAVVLATVFTLWTPQNFFSNHDITDILQTGQFSPTETEALRATFTPSPRPRIGLVAGHWGNDSGSVCTDGLTEAELNLKIATLVQQKLLADGFDVDLMQEKDAKLFEYQGLALVSIHNDSCDYINDQATGFKVAAAMSDLFPEKSSRLTACLVDRYHAITGLPFHANTITNDMTRYHAFDEIHNQTTAAIIETGFMNLDRQILTENTDLVAEGITQGVICYARNEDLTKKTPSQ